MQDNFRIIDGIKCYAPETATQNNYYDGSFFRELYRLEGNNFWFRARNKIIQHLVKKHLNADAPGRFFEIGCGTGYVLNGMSKFKRLKLIGGDIFIEGLKYAGIRNPDLEFIQVDATRLPFKEEFENIGAFDVLEHIDDDEKTIASVYKSLKRNGLFYISVPQYMFMWSNVDDLSYHKRRYSKTEIKNKLRKAGFTVEYSTSFVFTLFPVLFLMRLFKKKIAENISETDFLLKELRINSALNWILYLLMLIDIILIKTGIRLPFGGSLLVIARKRKD